MYGTVRTVVWEGGCRKAPSYPIQGLLSREAAPELAIVATSSDRTGSPDISVGRVSH
ncbi:hypothetical protein MES5069_1030001 [Mesorhizobium escarrei]|uniref:Uncharacterized protein n=1 Tax=Mesorhizobium escarrei TaxID=666018 RepID=A0ABM9DGA2_9HYPH|nr:hypothetical protein MES5069_1030001 [Mesorhizobium escarrei]